MNRRTTPSDSQRTPPASSVSSAVVNGWERGVKRTPHHMGVLERSMARMPARIDIVILFRNFIINSVHSGVVGSSMDGNF